MAGWLVHRPGRPKPYLARVQPPGKKAYSKSFRTKREANAWLKAQQVDEDRGLWVDPRRGAVRVGGWSQTWLDGRRVRPSTLAQNESYLRSLILPSFAERPLNRLSPSEIRKWIADLEDAGKAPATIRKAYQIMGSLIGQAVDDGLLPKSPMPRKPGLPASSPKQMRILTLEEIHALAEVIDPR